MIVGRRVLRYGRVGSTMDIAVELAAAGEPEGLVVVADEQTAGRGRSGRTWQAAPGSALLLTVLLRPDVSAERLGVLAPLAGVALAEAVESETGLRSWLKWPNDLWLGDRSAGRKAAGVLATARLTGGHTEYVLVGIGINVDAPAEVLPPGATSIGLELGPRRSIQSADDPAMDGQTDAGRTLDGADEPHPGLGGETARDAKEPEAPCWMNPEHLRERLFASILNRLNEHYAVFADSAGRPPLDGWRQRAALFGEPVCVDVGERLVRGVHAGIDDDGALLLRGRDGTLQRVVAGDLTRGPRLDEAVETSAS